MSTICPTVTATNLAEYRIEMNRVSGLGCALHIDLMDGVFAETNSPELSTIWWPAETTVDIHLMYQRPMDQLSRLIELHPRMVIIHNEADVHHMHFAAELHKAGIEAGLAILHDTPIAYAYQIMHSFDQVLIFSGHLGYHGGEADLGLLDKVRKVAQHHPECQIAWDGGINDQNAGLLARGGVDILNVGGFIQNSSEPEKAYATLKALVRSET
jgi:ribulose-phosphate 3-epimerase